MADDARTSEASRRSRRSFEAPEQGSADELLDASAGDPLDPMRHSAAHVMAEAVLDLFPGTKLGIGPAIEDGFYYDFQLARPLTPDDLAAIEARMAASVAADHPFVRRELPPEEGRAFFVRARPAVQGRDPRRPRGEGEGRAARRCRRRRVYEHGPFIDLCRGPHVESTGKIGPFKLLAVSGAYWRGDQKRPALQRDLRHGLVDAGGARQVPVAARGGEEARPPQAGRPARPVLLPRRLAGCRVLAPEGLALYQTLRDAMREIQERRGYQEIYTPPLVHQKLWEQSGHWDHYRDNMFLVEVDERDVQPQADELPRVDVHLPLQGPLVPRPAAAAVRVRRAPPQRAVAACSAA